MEKYSPIIKLVTIQMVLTIIVFLGWPMHQIDAQNAFLHGILQDDVFMLQSPGYQHPQFPHHVCHLFR